MNIIKNLEEKRKNLKKDKLITEIQNIELEYREIQLKILNEIMTRLRGGSNTL